MQTTLANILLHNPCGLDWRDGEGFAKLCMGLGFKPETGDLLSDFVANYPDPVSFTKMLDINGLHDTAWALRCELAAAKVPLLKYRAKVIEICKEEFGMTISPAFDDIFAKWKNGVFVTSADMDPVVQANPMLRGTLLQDCLRSTVRDGAFYREETGLFLMCDACDLISESRATSLFRTYFKD